MIKGDGWNGNALGSVKFYGDGTWSACSITGYGRSCALCHRMLRPKERAVKALFRADRGAYMQLYHPACASLRRAAGERPEFESAASAMAWAEEAGCGQCSKRPWMCKVTALECSKCLNLLRLSVSRDQEGGEDDEGGN